MREESGKVEMERGEGGEARRWMGRCRLGRIGRGGVCGGRPASPPLEKGFVLGEGEAVGAVDDVVGFVRDIAPSVVAVSARAVPSSPSHIVPFPIPPKSPFLDGCTPTTCTIHPSKTPPIPNNPPRLSAFPVHQSTTSPNKPTTFNMLNLPVMGDLAPKVTSHVPWARYIGARFPRAGGLTEVQCMGYMSLVWVMRAPMAR